MCFSVVVTRALLEFVTEHAPNRIACHKAAWRLPTTFGLSNPNNALHGVHRNSIRPSTFVLFLFIQESAVFLGPSD